MTEAIYEATATAWGGREGRAASEDGRVDLQLSIPKGMGGDDGPGTNPEQLFATGYAACFHSALKLVARQQKVDVTDSAVSVTI
jgi:osmotically inducible protein OsmC